MPELHFKGKEFVYNHHLSVPYCPLVPNAKKSIGDADLSGNLIIHGDNLVALKSLLPYYAGKVDCIFIDPPYNTGNENWSYSDAVNSPIMREWLNSNPVNKDDMLRHDKWLCMMYPRVKLLHELLADSGFIFVTLDDHEMAQFRVMMDEIFGEANFIAQIIVQTNKRGQTYKQIAKTHEYLICYGKSLNSELAEVETGGDNLPEEDKHGKFSARELRNRNPEFGKHNRPNLFFPIYVNLKKKDEKDYYSVSVEKTSGAVEVFPLNSADKESCWRWGPKKVSDNTEKGSTKVLFAKQTREGGWRIFEKYRKESIKAKTIWNETKHISEQGTTELGEIGLADQFQFPKPTGLLDDILALATNENSLVLDSFAGSATTGHAVLSANKHDGGHRRFILVEGESYADSLTAERMRRVIKGYSFEGIQSEELYRDNLTFSSLKKADKLLDHISSIENLEGHRFDAIRKIVSDGTLIVSGEKKVKKKTEGLGGEFTYCTLGEPVDIDKLLTGERLPKYEALGAWLFHTATGEALKPKAVDPSKWFLGETTSFFVWLIYKPDLNFLKSRDAALTLELAEKIAKMKPNKGTDKRHLVFAPAKYVPNKMLLPLGIEHAPLPFALYRVEKN